MFCTSILRFLKTGFYKKQWSFTWHFNHCEIKVKTIRQVFFRPSAVRMGSPVQL